MKSLRNSVLGMALILFPLSVHSQGVTSDSAAVRRDAQTSSPNGSSKTRGEESRFSDNSKRKGSVTEITSSQEVTFEQSENKAVFVGNVIVRDPQFTLSCQKLTAYLRGGEVAGESQAGDGTSGLERAVAEGNVVIIQDKVGADGKTTRYEGRGQKVVYEAASDQVTLSGSPSVREGINLHVATDPSTVMKITASEMMTSGPSKTIIAPSKND